MAFPDLKVFVDGDPTGNTKISEINGFATYLQGTPPGNQGVFSLICDKFDCRREFVKRAAASNIKMGNATNIPYDFVRLRYTWIGHIDVNSDSVSYTTFQV
jgi:hypothetical protein